MIRNIKTLLVLAIAGAGVLALFSSPPAFAQGETWKLTSNTTIQVSGGVFNGQNGNPSSVTLTLQNPNQDPAIWVNTSSFNLKASNGTPLEAQPRNSGQFCIMTNNTPSLVNNRTSVTFQPVHRDDCNKGAAARIVNNSNLTCGSATAPWQCNTLWQSSAAQHLDTNSKVTYAVAGAPLKCGDPGFMGPCQTPINYATADCTKTDGTPGQAEKCQAIKGCIVDSAKPEADCTKAWDDCMATYKGNEGGGYNACSSSIAKGDLTGGRSVGTGATGSDSNCKIDAIGWIICPVANFMAGIVDAAYGWITDLLKVPPINITTDTSNPTFAAWSIMRNFANVAFVIAFLAIVFSQMTSVGLSNYGIKRMLPRLIVAAILVNASYFICAIAVDISNILGHSFYTLLGGVKEGIPTPKNAGVAATGEGWLGLVGFAIGAGAAVAGVALLGPSIILPALIAALLAIVTVFLVLTLRQALIILLIFISPLAFVAYLLPNTESLFKKWLGLFKTLLLMYPIISIIFGASAVASTVVMKSSPTLAVQVMGALISIIPLALTPIIMRTAGGVLNKFGGMVNNPNKGPFDRMKKGAANIRKREQAAMNNKAFNASGRFSALNPRRGILKRNARLEAIEQNQNASLNRAKTDYIADAVEKNKESASQYAIGAVKSALTNGRNDKGKGLLDQMAAGGGTASRGIALGAAVNAKVKLEAEEVSAAQAVIKNMNLTQAQARTLAHGGEVNGVSSANDRALRTAAQQHVINTGDVKGMNDLINASTGWTDDKDRVSLADSLQASSSRPAYASMGNLAAMRQGVGMKNSVEMIEQAIKDNAYSSEKIASVDKDELNIVANVAATSAAVSVGDKMRLSTNAQTALTDPELRVKLGKSLDNVTHIKDNTAPPPLT